MTDAQRMAMMADIEDGHALGKLGRLKAQYANVLLSHARNLDIQCLLVY